MSDAVQLSLLDTTATTRAAGTRVLLTQSQIAAAFNLAPSTISRWPLQAVERHGREAYYCLAEAIAHRIGEMGRLDLQQERARLARVQSELAELRLERERGQVVPIEVAMEVLDGYITNCRARLLTIPAAAAPRVAGCTIREAAGVLREEIFTALRELAGDPGDLTRHTADLAAATAIDTGDFSGSTHATTTQNFTTGETESSPEGSGGPGRQDQEQAGDHERRKARQTRRRKRSSVTASPAPPAAAGGDPEP